MLAKTAQSEDSDASCLAIYISCDPMARKQEEQKTPGRARADGRKSLLVYLDESVIKQLKRAALDEDRPAYEITEEAVRQWLAKNRTTGR